ncbi:MAG: hypothetical protein WC661_20730 [Opitutaceae bacterium]
MKSFLTVLIALTMAGSAQAGIVGWFTSKTQPWEFIQKSGGIRIAPPMQKDGKKVLPVIYWPEGNSGLVVRKIKLKQEKEQLSIQVVTQVIEKGSDVAARHYVDLSKMPPGLYEVYYETVGDPKKKLGRILIK